MPSSFSIKISKKEGLELYRKLLLARLCEEKIRELYSSDEIKTPVHLGIGGEAISVGVCHAMPQGSRYFGTYRNHTLFLTLSEDTDSFFAELYGKHTGSCKGKGGSMHLMAPEAGLSATSAVVATTIPLAVGSALAQKYQKEKGFSVVFFGDGAVEEGVFWESLNFACLKKLKVLFVCEDNGLAIHSTSKQRQGFRSIPEAVKGFDGHVLSDDGMDVAKVAGLAREIKKRMEKNTKPGFLHLKYFRFLEHVGIQEDFQAGYRKRPSTSQKKSWDPLKVFESKLARMGVSKQEKLETVQVVEKQILESVLSAQKAPFPPPEELMRDVFAV